MCVDDSDDGFRENVMLVSGFSVRSCMLFLFLRFFYDEKLPCR